jgi:hypothetical protein
MADFEIWEYNGIPHEEPVFESDSLQMVRDYLDDYVYTDSMGRICASEGATVFFKGQEISLDAIFGEDDFYCH